MEKKIAEIRTNAMIEIMEMINKEKFVLNVEILEQIEDEPVGSDDINSIYIEMIKVDKLKEGIKNILNDTQNKIMDMLIKGEKKNG